MLCCFTWRKFKPNDIYINTYSQQESSQNQKFLRTVCWSLITRTVSFVNLFRLPGGNEACTHAAARRVNFVIGIIVFFKPWYGWILSKYVVWERLSVLSASLCVHLFQQFDFKFLDQTTWPYLRCQRADALTLDFHLGYPFTSRHMFCTTLDDYNEVGLRSKRWLLPLGSLLQCLLLDAQIWRMQLSCWALNDNSNIETRSWPWSSHF